MELLIITLAFSIVAVVGQFGDALYRRLTGKILAI
jgi:hypothetical protein